MTLEKLLVSSSSALASALVAVAGISLVHQLTLAVHHWAHLTLSVAAWGN